MRVNKVQKEEMRLKILEESKLLFKELGYDKTTTAIIAKNVGIAEGTIYNYFSSKTEIFLEIMSLEYENEEIIDSEKDSVIEQLYDSIYHYMKRILRLPKSVLTEVMVASLHLAKKKPKLMRKLAEIDFRFMRKFQTKLLELKEERVFESNCDILQLSEIIFGILSFEVMMYLYEKDRKKDYMYEQINIKLKVLLKQYIKEDNNGY